MKIQKCASAGTMESCDVYVEIEPNETGLEILLESIVLNRFEGSIRQVIGEVLKEFQIESGSLRIMDRGALECVLRARLETAILRGKEENQ